MKPFASILLLALLGVHLPVHAKMYKWIDASGKVHYSDREPPPQDTRDGASILNTQGILQEKKQGALTQAQRP